MSFSFLFGKFLSVLPLQGRTGENQLLAAKTSGCLGSRDKLHPWACSWDAGSLRKADLRAVPHVSDAHSGTGGLLRDATHAGCVTKGAGNSLSLQFAFVSRMPKHSWEWTACFTQLSLKQLFPWPHSLSELHGTQNRIQQQPHSIQSTSAWQITKFFSTMWFQQNCLILPKIRSSSLLHVVIWWAQPTISLSSHSNPT